MTHIIILNWNGGNDTWHCIESVLNLDDVHICLLDNNSTDDSLEYVRRQLDAAGIAFTGVRLDALDGLATSPTIISIIQSPENLGFAKGINYILRPLLRAGTDYIWLLNNDAIAAGATLASLLEMMYSDDSLGFVGSAILDGRNTDLVQCCGVRYYKWLGVAKMQWKDRLWKTLDKAEVSNNRTDFQHGASLLVRASILESVGLLDEHFFLYSEEHDWQERAEKLGYRNKLCVDSVVYHKGSMSTDSRKYLFFYHYCKSSVLFSRKHHPGITALVATICLTGITVLRTRLNMKSMQWALKGIREGWRVVI